MAADLPARLCLAPTIPHTANQYRPEPTGRPRLPADQAGPATAVSHNPVCPLFAAGHTISKPSQPPAIPDSEATRPAAGAAPTALLPQDSLRSAPSETGSSKNRAAPLTSIEPNAAHDWLCPAKQSQ